MKCKKYLDEIDNNISLKKILIVNFVQANAVLIKVCLLSRNSIFIKVARYNPPTMLEFLNNFDVFLFKQINGLQFPYIVESSILLLRDRYLWIPFYVFVIAFIFFNYTFQHALRKVLALFAVVGLIDFIGNNGFKKVFMRLRPCNVESLDPYITERIHCSSSYSFVSNHAANHFGLAVFLILLFPLFSKKIRRPLLIWAGMISFAQIFAGIHYPLDILGGGLLGTGIAFAMYYILVKVKFLQGENQVEFVSKNI